MTTDDKYKQFRQLMFNELGITRKDIEQWTREAVNERVDASIKHIISQDLITKSVDAAVAKNARDIFGGYETKNRITDAMAVVLKDTLTITLKPTKDTP
jgi:hypothetical protein